MKNQSTAAKSLPFVNVRFFKSAHASGICLGIEAATPTADKGASRAEKAAAVALAKEAIAQAAGLLYNFGGTNGKAHFTHERFAYILTTEDKLQHGLESILIQQDIKRKYSLPRASRRNFDHGGMSQTRTAARNFREGIEFERIRLGADNASESNLSHRLFVDALTA